MSDIDLDAIEARANAATPGPWTAERDFFIHVFNVRMPPNIDCCVRTYEREHIPMAEATATFIAAARTDIPALIARVREQEQEIAELRKRSEAWRAYAEHLVGCVECGQTSPDDCWEGGALRADALGLPRP